MVTVCESFTRIAFTTDSLDSQVAMSHSFERQETMHGAVTKYDQVISVLRKPTESRKDFEVNSLIPWFRKRSKLFESLKTGEIMSLRQNISVCN